MSENVYLVGMMAAGKSTIGRLVATRLGLTFHDTDKVIEKRAGADIAWIFDREGEPGFRRREEHVVDELTRAERVLIATGGGVVLAACNRQRMKRRGTVVYLHASAEVIAERVQGDRHRPLLQVGDVRGRVDALCSEREPLYRDAAHVVIDVGRRSARVVAADVIDALKGLRGAKP